MGRGSSSKSTRVSPTRSKNNNHSSNSSNKSDHNTTKHEQRSNTKPSSPTANSSNDTVSPGVILAGAALGGFILGKAGNETPNVTVHPTTVVEKETIQNNNYIIVENCKDSYTKYQQCLIDNNKDESACSEFKNFFQKCMRNV